jgi:hypothetical protein
VSPLRRAAQGAQPVRSALAIVKDSIRGVGPPRWPRFDQVLALLR